MTLHYNGTKQALALPCRAEPCKTEVLGSPWRTDRFIESAVSKSYICYESALQDCQRGLNELVEEAWDFPGSGGFLRREKAMFTFLVLNTAVWEVK